MKAFDYGALAELYPAKGLGPGPQSVTFMRFEHAADAIQFAFERLAPQRLFGAVLEVDEERFSGRALRDLYEGEKYPYPRKPIGTRTAS